MIKVSLTERDGVILRLSVSGHSGFSDGGSDIVCAGVTAAVRLLETTLNDVLLLGIPCTVDEKTADITFETAKLYELPSQASASGKAVIRGFLNLLSQLESEYPEFIKVLEVQHNA
ncbi:MAG: ribosomal-processing cysteine protease Prp [Oscillospiraceae bacterium]|jgi:uncharacterized protein YsxB (DUF464 family)|nr:ribosomal-processing cysteine protease Prp [Oscillospiraceae bacterium]